MANLSIPSSTIVSIINNPGYLSNSSELSSLGISPSQAADILYKGYNRGFRDIFLLNASMAAVAVVVSAVMIKHKELLRGDEERLRQETKDAMDAGRVEAVTWEDKIEGWRLGLADHGRVGVSNV